MCPDCIPVIAVAIAAATPLSAVKAFLAHTATVVSPEKKESFRYLRSREAREGRMRL